MAKQVSRTRKLLGKVFRIQSWLDLDRLKKLSLSLFSSAQTLFTPPPTTVTTKTTQTEQKKEFKQAAEKFNLDNKELTRSEQFLLYWSYCMVGAGVFLLILLGYYLTLGALKAALVTLMGVGLALVLAFRYHFFYYQIKRRRLGCSVKEWFTVGLLGRK